MASAISARQKGDSWQGLFFWQKSSSILKPDSSISEVRFEDGPKGFDDVVIQYKESCARVRAEGHDVLVDHFQCKWHVGGGTFGWQELIDPKYIGATSVSLLQNLAKAVVNGEPTDRFILVTTDRPHSSDPIVQLIGNTGNELLLHRLFDGTGDGSKMGRIRKALRDHLGVDDIFLKKILRQFEIHSGSPSIHGMIDILNPVLTSVGLIEIDPSSSINIYDDVIWKWHGLGKKKFSAIELHSLCSRDNLLNKDVKDDVRILGIRSFLHPIDDVSFRSDELLDFTSIFDGRSIRNSTDWDFVVYPKLKSFLIEHATRDDALRLILDTHYSIAVAAGYTLNVKSGKYIEIEQRTAGRHLWATASEQKSSEHDCVIDRNTGNDGSDIVLDISLTRDISSAIDYDISARNLLYGSRVRIRPERQTSSLAVRDANHANAIAELAIAACLSIQTESSEPKTIHLYYSGPNALAFFIGQHALALGALVIYEWDFEQQNGGGYRKGITLTPR